STLHTILKEIVERSTQSLGHDSPFVPGGDCPGLPIEWKVEEEYRAKGKNKDVVPVIEFRAECRRFAEHWLNVQRTEFMRLGGVGDWDRYYSTMSYAAEAQIARELIKFVQNGTLYRGSKPVMWSVVEKTALAEAEVEYDDYVSDQVWVRFPIIEVRLTDFHPEATEEIIAKRRKLQDDLLGSSILIWTTTPWTIPGNRAISLSL